SVTSNRQPFLFPNSSYSDGAGGFVENTDRPTASGGYAFWNSTYSPVKENYVTDATTLKLREVALNYTFNQNLIETLRLSDLTLGLVGRNVVRGKPADNGYTDHESNFPTRNAKGVGTHAQRPPTRQYGNLLTARY